MFVYNSGFNIMSVSSCCYNSQNDRVFVPVLCGKKPGGTPVVNKSETPRLRVRKVLTYFACLRIFRLKPDLMLNHVSSVSGPGLELCVPAWLPETQLCASV